MGKGRDTLNSLKVPTFLARGCSAPEPGPETSIIAKFRKWSERTVKTMQNYTKLGNLSDSKKHILTVPFDS